MIGVATIALAGFGLACLVVIPSDGPAAAIRERVLVPAWELPFIIAHRRPIQGPHDCLLCLSPYAAAVCWLASRVVPAAIAEPLLGAFATAGICGGVMLLTGFAQATVTSPSSVQAQPRKRCVACARKRAERAAGAALDGSSTVPR